ncbi:MAG: hypothetical protein DRI34_11455 [Deltaproteobacteria bacterium]|nr:MAG: hypothetical protein DRI34_11455 [Deltaproteobacteria bacterium]
MRRSLNISRVCQQALDRQIRRLHDLPLEVERLGRFLDRMARQQERESRQWFQHGLQEARDWLEHEASYAQVRLLGSANAARRLRRLLSAPPGPLREGLESRAAVADFDRDGYLQGWVAAIGAYWQFLERNL